MSILTLPLPQPAIGAQAFHEAAAHLAGAVAVVAWGAAAPQGLLVHTISVLSVEPARVLFAVDKGEPEHDALLLQQECGISLLAGDARVFEVVGRGAVSAAAIERLVGTK